jgi:hypothetical protein
MMTDRAGARRSVPASLRRRRRDIRAIQQGQRWQHDSFKQRAFRPNTRQDPNAHQHPEQVMRDALRRLPRDNQGENARQSR